MFFHEVLVMRRKIKFASQITAWAPYRRVCSPINRIDRNGPGFLQAVLNKNSPHVPLEVGELDGVLASVCPVDVIVDPVHCQTIRCSQLVLYHHCPLTALVYRGPATAHTYHSTLYWFLHVYKGKVRSSQSSLQPM